MGWHAGRELPPQLSHSWKGWIQFVRRRGTTLAYKRAGGSLYDFVETTAPTPQRHRAGAESALRPGFIHGRTLRLLQ
jgi:hypothetical protein